MVKRFIENHWKMLVREYSLMLFIAKESLSRLMLTQKKIAAFSNLINMNDNPLKVSGIIYVIEANSNKNIVNSENPSIKSDLN